MKRIAVAMSGGVDSSMAALVLKRAGYDVFGMHMRLNDVSGTVERVSAIAEVIGIPLHVTDMRELFEKEVVDFFAGEYLSGRTPNPCVVCNQRVKFGALWEKAKELGAEALSTGHYARIEPDEARPGLRLLRGKDPKKDQSYFLFTLTQEQLKRTIFPLGSMTKKEVRELARDNGFSFQGKPESQDLCFVSGRRYHDFIRARFAEKADETGEIVDEQGRALGRHKGIIDFTVGQRKGLGRLKGEGYYVLALKPDENLVIVGPEASLLKHEMLLRDVHWIAGEAPASEKDILVQIRYNSAPAAAEIEEISGGKARVRFSEPQRAVTPGQAAVFFRGEEVLGGGWIERDKSHGR